MELYNYFRSSASYRVRIALALKGLHYDYRAVHLAKGEQMAESYAEMYAGFGTGKIVPKGDRFVQGTTTVDEVLPQLL